MSDSPPKKKSHYFVAKHDKKICPVCGKEFESNRKTKVFCSRECYLINVKDVKRAWYQRNKDWIKPKQLAYENKKNAEKAKGRGVFHDTPEKYKCWIVWKRHVIIKQQLADLELLPKQINKYNKSYYGKVYEVKVKKRLDTRRLDYIKERLLEFELPHVKPREIEYEKETFYPMGDPRFKAFNKKK